MSTISISKTTFRRFLLGIQGLWPQRRFEGLPGVVSALHQMEALQLDPLKLSKKVGDFNNQIHAPGFYTEIEDLFHGKIQTKQ